MKRDYDLIRDLLLEFEKHPHDYIPIATDLENLELRRRRYHAELLCDSGLMATVGHEVFRLTNAGHDFLEAARDESIWRRTKTVVVESGGNATLEIVKAIAVGLLKQKIAKHTGLEF